MFVHPLGKERRWPFPPPVRTDCLKEDPFSRSSFLCFGVCLPEFEFLVGLSDLCAYRHVLLFGMAVLRQLGYTLISPAIR